jgi:glucose/arabinose dehydrogenase
MRSFAFSNLGLWVVCGLTGWVDAQAQTPRLSLERVGTGFRVPVFATSPPGDTNRLFVIEQISGQIRILDLGTGQVGASPFLTVSPITTTGEQGLLGLAFHPGYATNGYFYVNYTTTGGGPAGHTEITRYRALGDPGTAATAEPASKTVLLTYDQPEPNHNAGWMGFGLDGYLYIASGDGGGGDDRHGPIGNGQNRNSLLGKILRIDVDQEPLYGIPPTNPFRGVAGQREEIWAFGLRNPWRCSIDRLTGDLWIGDVGQNAREEIDFNPAGVGGLNFGWRPREGSIQNPAFPNEVPVTPATGPVHDYTRSEGVSVIGGYVYRGQAIPGLQGTYIFGDYGSGRFWTFQYDGTNRTEVLDRTAELNPTTPRPVRSLGSFGEDAAGELYVCDLADGEVYRIVSAEPASLTLANPRVADNVFTFQFTGTVGQSYVVEARELSAGSAWTTLTNVTASSTAIAVSDAIGSAGRFYRVRVP